MRSLIALSLSLWFAARVDAADASFPYIAQIKLEGAVVRSGPGEEYYATQRLAEDTRVEVYRREPSGWLALRPPAASFSWVSASSLRSTGDASVAEIVGLRAVSWVGSELDRVRDHKWQVQLNPGERLEVLGRASLQIFQDSGTEEFVKVAPPAGEFRWIQERFVRALTATTSTSSPENSSLQQADFRILEESDESRSTPRRDGFVARKADRAEAPLRVDAGDTAANASVTVADAGLERRIKQVDVDLALEFTQPPLAWDLAPHRQEIGELLARADSTIARARARRIQQKVEELEILQQRYLGLDSAASTTATVISADDDLTIAEPRSTAAYDPRFDGSGWLLPVHSKKLESPPYALLDNKGKILQFISPAPGLNLHRYLRLQVGIVGQQAPTRFLDKPHLTAHRVIDLARHRR